MKIAVWHNLPSGGGKRALYYHVRGLVERGHSVQAWCPSTSDRNYLPLGELVTEHVLPINLRPPRKSGWRGRLLGALHADELHDARALDEHCRKCADEINRGTFDILFSNSSNISAAASIGRYVKTKKILYLQEPNRGLYEAGAWGLPWVAISAKTRPWTRPRYLLWLLINLIGLQRLRVLAREERLNAKAFNRIFVNSFFSREGILRAYGLDSTVCYLGVDTQLFANRHRARENFVVGLGEIRPHKNVELVIRAVALLPKPRPRLVWIGNACSEWYYEEMRSLAESFGVSFETRACIADNELVETLNRAAVMAYAPRLEPFGFAALEANACGLPVVAVAEGGLRETVIDKVNGLLTGSEPAALAAGIQRLINDKDYAEQLGRRGAEIVAEKWSLHDAVSRLERLLEETVGVPQCSNPGTLSDWTCTSIIEQRSSRKPTHGEPMPCDSPNAVRGR